MTAEIITIGDEILIGQIVDTNSAWLGERLNGIGLRVGRITSIQDDRSEITEGIDSALLRADVVIVTGGLGPTKDDITKLTLAEYFSSPLVTHRPSYELIRDMCERRGLPFNTLNQRQADVPECCTVLLNRNGTAPGMWFDHGGKVLISLPGVPFEMKALFAEEAEQALAQRFGMKSIIHRNITVYGISESALAETIELWETALPPHLKLAYLPNPGGIRLRLSAYGVEAAEADREIDEYFSALQKIIPGYIIGYGDTTLEEAVAELLESTGESLSVAESCTGGVLAARFTAMAGASNYFRGGVVAYSNEVKSSVLGVNAADIEAFGAVSSQVAAQMADGVRKVTGSTYAISTTGVAGPDGGTAEKPVGTVWIGLSAPSGTFTFKKTFGSLRGENIKRASSAAIDALRRHIIEKHQL